MRTNKLYNNASKCIFGAHEIPFLGFVIGKRGIRADPDKVKAIMDSPIPKNQRDLRKGLGLANYLHKYSEYYADMDQPLTDLLQKDIYWCWDNTHADAFWAIRRVSSMLPFRRCQILSTRLVLSAMHPILL